MLATIMMAAAIAGQRGDVCPTGVAVAVLQTSTPRAAWQAAENRAALQYAQRWSTGTGVPLAVAVVEYDVAGSRVVRGLGPARDALAVLDAPTDYAPTSAVRTAALDGAELLAGYSAACSRVIWHAYASDTDEAQRAEVLDAAAILASSAYVLSACPLDADALHCAATFDAGAPWFAGYPSRGVLRAAVADWTTALEDAGVGRWTALLPALGR